MLVSIPEASPFTVHNIPFGVFSVRRQEERRRVGTAIGTFAVDLARLVQTGHLSAEDVSAEELTALFAADTLNAFMARGRPLWRSVRRELIALFNQPAERFAAVAEAFVPLDQVDMHLPIAIGDYTDFYASKEHASNVGEMFRGKENALMPNWLHLPVGYHGRASSVVVSGTPIIRPCGQSKPPEGAPLFGPSKKLDFELEMAFVIGKGNALGVPIKCQDAAEHIFGVCLMNDWSARDIQAWEYVPLGPFLGKSFGTTLSPWIVTLDALEPFLVAGPAQSPVPLSYLQETPQNTSYDVNLTVRINDTVVCRSNLRHLYWSFAQQLAHHTVNGCNMRPGDICGTGTISGPTKDSFGSMLELSWNGSQPMRLNDGSERTYLQDGDTVTITGCCANGPITLGFGECVGTIHAAHL